MKPDTWLEGQRRASNVRRRLYFKSVNTQDTFKNILTVI